MNPGLQISMTYDATDAQAGWALFRVGQGILFDGSKVLLSGNRWFSGKPLVWTLPGGRAEEGEGIGEALVREFKEETGLDIMVGEPAYVAESRSLVQKRLFLVCAFVVRVVGGTLTREGDMGVEELRWVEPEELGIYMPAESLGAPLREYLKQPGHVRYWFFPEYSA